MRKFLDDNFLLSNDIAVELYHKYAKDMPIFDYHCHLNPEEIAENKSYRNITQLWLGGDHYKWRAMRSNGIAEEYITGSASDYEKFKAWARTMPYCVGNPLYVWSHLELKRFFNIDTILNENTADEIWEKANEKLSGKAFTAKELIKKSRVKVICTTDDAIDTLEYHKKIRKDEGFTTKVLPTLRPDKGINIENSGFTGWVKSLSEKSGTRISTYKEFIISLEKRVEFFHQEGCRLSDHGMDNVFYEEYSYEEVEAIFQRALKGERLNKLELNKYKTATMISLSEMYSAKGWTMQLHIGAIRNNNMRMLEKLGVDSGFDSIGDKNIAEPLSKLLNAMNSKGELPQTILYCINPRDNELLGTMIGNFQGGGLPGKLQFGAGWWFNDQKDGMTRQMVALANLGLLRRFVGMTTDSRSFLSYTRHEYFRRVMCNLISTWVEAGEVPYDLELLGNMVKDICCKNAESYFNIEL